MDWLSFASIVESVVSLVLGTWSTVVGWHTLRVERETKLAGCLERDS